MAELARRLFDFYHEQELAANPETFLTGVVELFCAYPAPIVAKAVSPVFGIPSKHKFPPRLSEIKEFLDGECRVEVRQYPVFEPLPPPPPKPTTPRPRQYTYKEFEEMAARGEVAPRAVGRFEK